jgi:hypothetical protein
MNEESSVPGHPVSRMVQKEKPRAPAARRLLERPTEATRVMGPSGSVAYHRGRTARKKFWIKKEKKNRGGSLNTSF